MLDMSKMRTAGLINELKDTMKQITVFSRYTQLFTRKLKYSQLRLAPYGWKGFVPYPTFWPQGMPRNVKTFPSYLMYTFIRKFESTIEWKLDDEKDDLLNDLISQVQLLGKRYQSTPFILLSEYLNGLAVENGVLQNAYDGVSIFSTVDGDGNDRFGVTDGNIVSGSGTTTAAIYADLFAVQKRFMNMKDSTSNKPIFEPNDVTFQNMFVLMPNSLNLPVQKLSEATLLLTEAGLTAPEKNILATKFEFGFNPFLTDTNDWFVLLKHSYWKPFALRPPQDIESTITNIGNSDKARELGIAGIYTNQRMGVSPWCPFVIIKVTN